MALHLGGLARKASSACLARVTSPGTSRLFRELVPSAGCVSDPYSSNYAHGGLNAETTPLSWSNWI